MPRLAIPLLVAAALTVPAACGSDTDASAGLSPAAAAGRALYLDKGCAACHGSDGAGQVGPSLVDIVGAEVAIEDGPAVVRDRAYLVESIVEPQAKIVEGYRLPMPRVELSDGEIESIVSYIEALSVGDP